MKLQFYKPEKPVSGPAYGMWFKLLATLVTAALAAYAVKVGLGFPLMQYSFGVKLLVFGSALMLALSYFWFLRSVTSIGDKGIVQTGLYNRQVEWRDIRSAKMIGIPFLSWIFPPRLVVRTGNSFTTFNGGTRELLIEFAKISLAYQMKP
ncbi:hypothetical protein [Noviherbaspirillum massiliense]|uniref:hypothetical protein n=1 Tax=Noviherbaspirillum massiliense TaxID=1465823 RepID=UPI000304A768|nr:hypothetical protein [Noviherbaspirillum massiliense]